MIKRCLASAAWSVHPALAASFAIAAPSTSAVALCGVERWNVKALQDPAGRALDLNVIKKTTVSALRALPVQRGTNGSRGTGAESTFHKSERGSSRRRSRKTTTSTS
jgi:hypothetical protein